MCNVKQKIILEGDGPCSELGEKLLLLDSVGTPQGWSTELVITLHSVTRQLVWRTCKKHRI